MALPAKPLRIPIVFALVAAGVTAANAQSLNQSNPPDRFSDVMQFGAPRDTKPMFCGEGDYPRRSVKYLYVSPPPPPAVQESVMPAPQSIQPPEEFLHAEVPAKKKPLKKKRKKPAIQHECKPISKPK